VIQSTVATAWRPSADVYETPTGVSVTIELAGIAPAEVQVLFLERAVVVEGRRRLPALDTSGIYHAAEIRRGHFRLEIALPAEVAVEPVELRSELGLLLISFAKRIALEGR
jgi:HSP20 family molecular chaperone IbpA